MARVATTSISTLSKKTWSKASSEDDESLDTVAPLTKRRETRKSKLHRSSLILNSATSRPSIPRSRSAISQFDVQSPTEKKTSSAQDDINSNNFAEKIKENGLQDLEVFFTEAANQGKKGLTMEEFRVAMKSTLGYNLDDHKIDTMFMKVDTNCDEVMEWSEYLTYILLEYQEKESMISMDQACPFPKPMIQVHSNHLESICRVTMLKAYVKLQDRSFMDMDESSSRYLTLSREGVLNVWSVEWIHQKSMTLESSAPISKNSWLTDMACLSNSSCIAVASADYDISFYSMTSNLIQKKFQIRGLEHCALTFDYYFDPRRPKHGILLWGDTSGSIFIMRFYDYLKICLFGPMNSGAHIQSLLSGDFTNLVVAKFANLHNGWIEEVRYFTSEKGMECFISGSMAEDTALIFADITPKVAGSLKDQNVVMGRRSCFQIRKGVMCLDYDPDWNLIVTGSRDCDVKMWNPYVMNKPSVVLKGHTFALVQVVVRGAENQVISVSKDKNLRIWDLKDYSCKHSIHGRNIPLGRLDVSAMYMNEWRKELIVATNQIGLFQPSNPTASGVSRQCPKSHLKPITGVLYNPLFNEIVTSSEDGMVIVWDIETGTKCMQFFTERDVGITAMSFDPTGRRLATGSQNGSVSLWNFHNGSCLRRLPKFDDMEVEGIVFCRRRVVSAGWNKYLTSYDDQFDDDSSTRHLKRPHLDDITCLAFHKRDSLLASSSYDGDIFIWSVDKEDVIVALNMYQSLLPIHLGSRDQKGSTPDMPDKPSKKSFSYSPSSKEKSQAWQSSQSSRSSFIDHDPESAIQNAEFEVLRWLPDYLPWVGEGHDSHVDSSDTDSTSSDLSVSSKLYAVRKSIQIEHVIHKGGLLGYFEAAKAKNEAVLSMDSDDENTILITGDSRGYLQAWDISSYCIEKEIEQRRQLFDEVSDDDEQDNTIGCIRGGLFTRPTYVPLNKPPPMLWAMRAHLKPIVSVAYTKAHGLIASGSSDCSVRLWNEHGRYVGTFGQKQKWSPGFPLKDEDLDNIIPEDIRRVASATTIRVSKGKHYPHWNQIKNVVKFMGHVRSSFSAPTKKSTNKKIAVAVPMAEYWEPKRPPGKSDAFDEDSSRRGSITVWMEDAPRLVRSFAHPTDQVEKTFTRLEREGIKSNVLGKNNYKPIKRHKESTVDADVKWSENLPLVYSTLPFFEMAPIHEPKTPESMFSNAWKECFSTKFTSGFQSSYQRALGFNRVKRFSDRSFMSLRRTNSKHLTTSTANVSGRMSRVSMRPSTTSTYYADGRLPRAPRDQERRGTDTSSTASSTSSRVGRTPTVSPTSSRMTRAQSASRTVCRSNTSLR